MVIYNKAAVGRTADSMLAEIGRIWPGHKDTEMIGSAKLEILEENINPDRWTFVCGEKKLPSEKNEPSTITLINDDGNHLYCHIRPKKGFFYYKDLTSALGYALMRLTSLGYIKLSVNHMKKIIQTGNSPMYDKLRDVRPDFFNGRPYCISRKDFGIRVFFFRFFRQFAIIEEINALNYGNVYIGTLNQRPEGIDTISLMFYSDYVNWDSWIKYRGKLSEYVSTRTVASRFKRYYYFDIQAECLDMDKNILQQVLEIVYNELYLKGFLNNVAFINDKIARFKIFNKWQNFMSLHAIDFNFDFPENVLSIRPEVISQYMTTVYSKRPRSGVSKATIYDRRAILKKQNKINHDKIDGMERPIRFEIRFRKYNCNYMNLLNLDGKYHDIMEQRWCYCIARAVFKYISMLGAFDLQSVSMTNPYFCQSWELCLKNRATPNPKALLETPKRKKADVTEPLNRALRLRECLKDDDEAVE